MDIHPSGDHLIVGGYDRKLCWFDLELSDKPYKILRWISFPGPHASNTNLFWHLSATIHGLFDLYTFIHRIHYLLRLLTMGPFRSFIHEFTTIL